MSERALVLGGGGAVGNAWEIGVVAGLLDAGLDVTAADLIVGTSAGSTVAAQITGANPADLFAATTAAALPPPGGRPNVSLASLLEKSDAIIAAATDPADMRRRLGASALAMDAGGDRSVQWRAVVAARLPSQDWPRRLMQIVAVEARTGEPVVFDRDSGVDLVDAVAASTSGPGAAPYRIDENRYIDGGYRTNVNADLASGYRQVLIIAPFGERTRLPLEWNIHVAAQVEKLRTDGSRVETVYPNANSRSAFGETMMDLSARPAAARAGYAQGRAFAAQVNGFWH